VPPPESGDREAKAGMNPFSRCAILPAVFAFFLAGLPCLAQPPDAARQAELLYLLDHDCGSCHGMNRKGGLGPPLLPESLADRPPAVLEATVLEGRAGTPMPPWRGLLTEEEVHWLVRVLLEGRGL
jgi:cytochrome c55X